MFFEISAIQQFSGVNLNRDDMNSIKTLDFGGYKRQRVSSQCWKNAIRSNDHFVKILNKDYGIRTKKYANEIFKLVGKDFETEKNQKQLGEFFKHIGLGELEAQRKKKNDSVVEDEKFKYEKLKTMYFTSKKEIELAAQIIKKHNFNASEAAKEFSQEVKNIPLAPDICLFGRMAANDANLNVEAAVQFAHAISTNEILIEDDFYTALDDLNNSEEQADAGASMIGYSQIASPCLYRYACISWDTLIENTRNDKEYALICLEAFLKAFTYSVPSGKSKSTAPTTVPELILISFSKKQPINLVNAFINPVKMDRRNAKKSLSEQSCEKFMNYLVNINEMYEWSKERNSICYHMFDQEFDAFDKSLQNLKIPAIKKKFDENLSLFVKETAWSK